MIRPQEQTMCIEWMAIFYFILKLRLSNGIRIIRLSFGKNLYKWNTV